MLQRQECATAADNEQLCLVGTAAAAAAQAPLRELGHALTLDTRALDGLRGLAVLWVGVFHLFAYTVSPLNISGEAVIPIFYVLSGFLLELAYGEKFCLSQHQQQQQLLNHGCRRSCAEFLHFLVKRLARLYPTYLLCNALILPIRLHPTVQLTVPQMILSSLMLTNWLPLSMLWPEAQCSPPLLPSWTISTFFCLYTLFPLLTRPLNALAGGGGTGVGHGGLPTQQRMHLVRTS
jgi:peptidoglycan/LPS O-acetylase OafA/YrhL